MKKTKKKNQKRDNPSDNNEGIERRLEALLVLISEQLSLIAKQENASAVNSAKEKASTLLLKGGISQENAAKLLGIKRERVTKASKKIKL